MQHSIFEPWIELRQLGQHGAHQRKLAHKASKAQTLAAQGEKNHNKRKLRNSSPSMG
jgi:hypothetical protein